MSLFGVRDLDYLLLESLEDQDLFNFRRSNKYYWGLCDEKFWKKRHLEKHPVSDLDPVYINFYKKSWKDHYFKTEKYSQNAKEGAYIAIKEDDLDLFLFFANKIYGSTFFFLKRNLATEPFQWKGKDFFLPILIAIQNDSINCYHYLRGENYYLTEIIRSKSEKLVREIIEEIPYSARLVFLIFEFDFSYLMKLLILKEEIDYDEVIHGLLFYRDLNWEKIRNSESFKLFITQSHFTPERLYQIKLKALERNNQELIRSINKYTSYFNK